MGNRHSSGFFGGYFWKYFIDLKNSIDFAIHAKYNDAASVDSEANLIENY